MKKSLSSVLFACILYCMPFLLCAQPDIKDSRYVKSGFVHCTVTSMKGVPKQGETVVFEGKRSQKQVQSISDSKGICDVWLPKGDVYLIKVLTVGKEEDYSSIEVPDKPGAFRGNYSIQFDLPTTVTLDDVLFETGKSILKPSSFPSLLKVAELLKHKKGLVIEVVGHTDNRGDAATNMKLSLQRAQVVKAYLAEHSGAGDRIQAVGHGADEPIAENDSEEGRKLNRRTEIHVLKE